MLIDNINLHQYQELHQQCVQQMHYADLFHAKNSGLLSTELKLIDKEMK